LYSSNRASQSQNRDVVVDKVSFVAKGRDYKQDGNQVIFKARGKADVESSVLIKVRDEFVYLRNTMVQIQERLQRILQLEKQNNLRLQVIFNSLMKKQDEILQEVEQILKKNFDSLGGDLRILRGGSGTFLPMLSHSFFVISLLYVLTWRLFFLGLQEPVLSP
jgi:hypothetical protein